MSLCRASLEITESAQLVGSGRVGCHQIVAHFDVPADGVTNLVQLHSGMDRCQVQLVGVGVGFQDTKVGDNDGRPRSGMIGPPLPGPTEANRGDELDRRYERPL